MTRESANSLPPWADLLWKEWEYRHSLYWKSVYLWGGAALAILLSPFWRTELKSWGIALYIFPLVGWLVALTGAWHLRAEAARLRTVGEQYDRLRKAAGVFTGLPGGSTRRTWRQHSIALRIGTVVTFLFAVGSSFLASLCSVLLWGAPEPARHPLVLKASTALVGLLVAVTLWFFFSTLKAHNDGTKRDRS